MIIQQRFLYAFTYSLARCKMNDTANFRIFFEYGLGGVEIAQVYFLKSRTNAGNLFDTIQYIFTWIREVVYDDHVITSLLEFHRRV